MHLPQIIKEINPENIEFVRWLCDKRPAEIENLFGWNDKAFGNILYYVNNDTLDFAKNFYL